MLVMLLMVRDEADIVGHTLRFHLNRGVDLVLATDNGSTDGTVEILRDFERQGVLRLWHSDDRGFDQAETMTRMAICATEEHRAKWLLPCDADEFWCPAGGDLAAVFAGSRATVLMTRVANMVSAWDRPFERWSFGEQPFRVARPLAFPQALRPQSPDQPITPPPPLPSLFYEARGKVAVAADGLRRIHQGSHEVDHVDYRPALLRDVVVRHFPVRGWEQFRRKARAGGTAYALNKSLDWRLGWHWRRWHALDLEGRLEEEYRHVLPSSAALGRALEAGILESDRSLVEAHEAEWRQTVDAEPDALYQAEFFRKHEPWRQDYRHLAHVLAARLPFESVVDFGCGNGFVLQELAALGKRVLGVDASHAAGLAMPPAFRRHVRVLDLRLPLFVGRFDLVLCTEVAEHIESRYAASLVANLARAAGRSMVFSAATPEQIEGVHHVNLREPGYWIELFARYGLGYRNAETRALRATAKEKNRDTPWLPLNLLVFEREPG